MDIPQLISNMKHITNNDKSILENIYTTNNLALYKNLSFYSTKFTEHNLDNYQYLQTLNDEDIYTINLEDGISQIFFDRDKKVIFFSRFWYDNIIAFIRHIYLFFNNIYDTINFNTSLPIDKPILCLQSWFTTYGHFMDESYNLYDFLIKYKSIDNSELTVLQYYPENKDYFKNYNSISAFLFKTNFINTNNHLNKLFKIKKLFLIRHSYNMSTFHAFPTIVTKKILDNIPINNDYLHNRNVFITRGISTHLPRNLDNQSDIETFFRGCNTFKIINPEETTYENFINFIRFSKTIVITWGGALVNLVYLQPNTNVIILKSKSYEHETIDLFNKIINQLKLNVVIITHVENKINIEELRRTLNKNT